jgi:hypothetical protein
MSASTLDVPLIRADSPLRLRVDLDQRQAAQLEAIAVVANVIDLLYRRLVDTIRDFKPERGIEVLIPDAWGIIDWVHRLDGLVDRCRGLSPRLSFVVDYRNASRLVENHRHAVQHLEGTLPSLEESGRAPWGHLSWTVLQGIDGQGGEHFAKVVAIPSQLRPEAQSYRMGEVLFPRNPIDNISLYSADGEAEISLTGQHESMVRFLGKLEGALARMVPESDGGILRIKDES